MKGWLRAFLWIVGILAVIAAVLRIWFVDFYRIPEDETAILNWSNAPNLEPGDLVMVWRRGEPHVGDIVACVDPSVKPPVPLVIARVVGIGGDVIEQPPNEPVKINHYRVNTGGCSLSEPRTIRDEYGTDVVLTCTSEEDGSTTHDIYTSADGSGFDAVTVAPGRLFLLSDTRVGPWAKDSRDPSIGQVPIEWCSRRFVLRLWSKKGWSDAARRLSFLF